MIWFTSDTHFGHENVLKFTDRPWETIWQMNDAIVDNINGRVAVVGQRDRRQAGRARAGGVQEERAIVIDRKKPR